MFSWEVWLEIDAGILCSVGAVFAFLMFLALRAKAKTGWWAPRLLCVFTLVRVQVRPKGKTTSTTSTRLKAGSRLVRVACSLSKALLIHVTETAGRGRKFVESPVVVALPRPGAAAENNYSAQVAS
jgi:hypothetical protein